MYKAFVKHRRLCFDLDLVPSKNHYMYAKIPESEKIKNPNPCSELICRKEICLLQLRIIAVTTVTSLARPGKAALPWALFSSVFISRSLPSHSPNDT